MKNLVLGLSLMLSMSLSAVAGTGFNNSNIDSITIKRKVNIKAGTERTRIDIANKTAFYYQESCTIHHDRADYPRHISQGHVLEVDANDAITASWSAHGGSSYARIFIKGSNAIKAISCEVSNQFESEVTLEDVSSMLNGAVDLNLSESVEIE